MEENKSLFDFAPDGELNTQIADAARWSKLFAVISLSLLVLGFLLVLIAGPKLTRQIELTQGITIEYSYVLIFALLILVFAGMMLFFLLRASNRIKSALSVNNQEQFNKGLADFKVYFSVYGVLAVINVVFTAFSLF